MDRDARLAWLLRGGLVAALALLVYGAAGGPGWTSASGDALLAAHLERPASAPLYGLVGGAVVHLLPVGEPGFRLAVANAALGVLVLLGVMRVARVLLPRDPIAGAAAAILLGLAPPFRDAAGLAGPAMLGACGAVWAVALAIEAAREPAPRRAVGALACAGIALGAAPWLGALLAASIAAGLARARPAYRGVLAAGLGVLGALVAAMWLGAAGRLPAAAPDLPAVVAATGRGAAGVVVGAGLAGAAFAALTGLPAAGWLAAALAVAAGHAIAFDHDPVALLALLAAGAALVPGALVRVVASSSAAAGARRHLAALAAGAPLVGVALLAGPAVSVDDPGDAPARLANDLVGELPPGPGLVVATRDPSWMAIRYAQAIAGARPDLALAPLGRVADTDAIEALRRGYLAASDAPAFGRLDPRRALPRGRGFQLLAEPPHTGAPVPPPARYASAIGARMSIALALARARYERAHARLDAAARAAGLVDRFRAADLALLSVAAPTRARPALFDFVPPLDGDPGERWLLDLFGDDLAWLAGLPQPEVDRPAERALHALWRRVWRGELRPGDPAIAELGPPAVLATWLMLGELAR